MSGGTGGGGLVLAGDPAPEGLAGRVTTAIARATESLLARQHARGHWQAPVEASAQMEARYVFFNRMLGRDRSDLETRVAERLVALQGTDGSWPACRDGAGDLSTTVEVYFALKLVGFGTDEPRLVRAREFVLAQGGLGRAKVATRTWLACFGQFPWAGVPTTPVELVLLPPWAPISMHALACPERSALVPLTLLRAYGPSTRVPTGAGAAELWRRPPERRDVALGRTAALVTWKNLFLAVDRTLRLAGRSPWRPLRRRAVARAIEWVLHRQESSGQWAASFLATVHAVLALNAVGFASDHPVMVSGVRGVDDFLVECEGTLMVQPSVAPARDTALAVRALVDSGLDPGNAALARAAERLVAGQSARRGDWAVAKPELEPGGWGAMLAGDWAPNVHDSALIAHVLGALPVRESAAGRRALAYGLNWTLGMQGRSGGWGTFDADGGGVFLDGLPLADAGTLTDPPAADVTGRVLELMGSAGYDRAFGRVGRAVAFLRRRQRTDGSWDGRGGASRLYGTSAVLAGLAAVGEDLRVPWIRRAVEWLRGAQSADGGWGERAMAQGGESSPTETAWALLALLAAERPTGGTVERGIDYLVRTQRPDGTWPERLCPGGGPPRAHLRWHLDRDVFPLMALGRFRTRLAGEA
jgi:squalene-hopene/tetraprenyl-beta-curcumene cyclase